MSPRCGADVQYLFVAKEYQRRGVATKLWKQARIEALASKGNGVFSVKSSDYAVPFYEALGFLVTGGRTEKEGITIVRMTLDLGIRHG